MVPMKITGLKRQQSKHGTPEPQSPESEMMMSELQRLTEEQAAIITGYTNITMGAFSKFHEMVEEKLGRPVFTHELANKDLWEREINPAFKEDFMAIVYEETPNQTKEVESDD